MPEISVAREPEKVDTSLGDAVQKQHPTFDTRHECREPVLALHQRQRAYITSV
jgi:hypothetical protein